MSNWKLDSLRNLMKERGIDLYYIPTADFHESEYVIDYFKARAYMTGFTGSAGVAVVTAEEAGLWTDGRYFIQAAKQLEGSGFELYKMGNEGVPTVSEFVKEKLPENGCVGFDGRCVNTRVGEEFAAAVKEKNGRLATGEDLVDLVWTDRPALASGPVFYLDEQYSGETVESKLSRTREAMKAEKADCHIISSLDDVAWTLNIRGCDIKHFPVVLSWLVITGEKAVWFVDESCISDEIRGKLSAAGVETAAYGSIYSYVAAFPETYSVLMERGTVNYRISGSMPSSVTIIDKQNPAVLMKATKNAVEVENIKKAHVLDGIAVTKFMYWLKKNIGTIPMTEISVSDYLESLRAQQEGFQDISFETIAGYGANAAMMHYSATPESNAVLEPKGFLLVDSGGHYMTGSTDITRTFALGELTADEKKFFTLVAKSNLNLANVKFLHGCSGVSFDILARGPLWQYGVDYQCGTGHGVGYMLSIHEKPNGFRWRFRADSNTIFEEGMITTDEPGVYIEGQYGIRTENELLCVKDEKNMYGQFMKFENITYVPIDLDAIDPAYLNEDDKRQLNEYHAMVYETIAPYLTAEEQEWLKVYTRAI